MHKLLGNFPDFRLRQISVVFKDLKEFTLSKLSNHAELMDRFKRVKQKNNILMIQALKNINFLS